MPPRPENRADAISRLREDRFRWAQKIDPEGVKKYLSQLVYCTPARGFWKPKKHS